MSLTEEILSQIHGNPFKSLQKVDELWTELKNNTLPLPHTIKQDDQSLESLDYDVVICGGTLGILIGATLVMKGWRVALIERGKLQGREQEWNISRKELEVFIELNLLSEVELKTAISTEYNPARLSFPNSDDIWVKNVLNIGVDPVYLLETLKTKFLEAGGILLENTAYQGSIIHPNGVEIVNSSHLVAEGSETIKTRLLIDAMGHFSPLVRQARQGKKPDAVCLVVGTCATGYPNNQTGDIFASFTPLKNQCQYFWEAFPARDGRTTYLFTYLDANPQRFSLESLFEDYFKLLPEYQQIELNQLTFKRALFGFFPCYKDSPLKMPWNRVLAVGDSSGNQSPLSFGGFGAMVRHLQRLTDGIDHALTTDQLSQNALSLLQPYQPSLSVTWLFQRSMSVGIQQTINPEQINQLLTTVFQGMEQLGEPILKPFLQDVVQFSALTKTLSKTAMTHPDLIFKIIPQVGLMSLIDWTIHYWNLGLYTGLYPLGKTLEPMFKKLPLSSQYYYYRWLEAWKYGSGQDYE
ncbi:NAD(P)/FAD-dependent oxidoreductase [Planktothrix sp. PCC 11201]|uniref:NAD(P)/FAD-dependent oxidoreductase n=1 Tax=Planktothrix sp. PCC 11201 TaxID=1729650 RepID=UPI0009A90F2E|nr:FAD-dependent oxidoreductase [Planktothrix sp. PCC 11201]